MYKVNLQGQHYHHHKWLSNFFFSHCSGDSTALAQLSDGNLSFVPEISDTTVLSNPRSSISAFSSLIDRLLPSWTMASLVFFEFSACSTFFEEIPHMLATAFRKFYYSWFRKIVQRLPEVLILYVIS
ncbi:hypothetical protein S225a_27510 [Candidatus Brocadiaceae bacterium S225]|nr:hypothetical protein S225a_27510 [Candidatus Brocadiaceae bacterium S225]